MFLRRPLRLVVLGVASMLPVGAWGDDPPPARMSELTPPTIEDWLRLYKAEWERGLCDHDCKKPVWITGQIIYLPDCPAPCPSEHCGKKHLQPAGGGYGIFHPGPYYIPAVRVGVRIPGNPHICENCSLPNAPQRLPSAGPIYTD